MLVDPGVRRLGKTVHKIVDDFQEDRELKLCQPGFQCFQSQFLELLALL